MVAVLGPYAALPYYIHTYIHTASSTSIETSHTELILTKVVGTYNAKTILKIECYIFCDIMRCNFAESQTDVSEKHVAYVFMVEE
jgi:hypothetical protein